MSTVPLMSLHTRGTDNVHDSEFTEDEEDPLESVLNQMKYRSQLNKARDFWSGVIIAGTISFVTGFLLSYIVFLTMDKNKFFSTTAHLDPGIPSSILNNVNASKLFEFLRALNSPHSENGPDSLRQAQLMQQHFRDHGMDSVSALLPSRILLSYFKDDLNTITVISKDGEVVYRGTPLHFDVPQNKKGLEVINITTGSVVFLDFGKESDFHYLESKNISIKDKIVLVRVGKVPAIDLVDSTLRRGAAGVVLIVDKEDGHDSLVKSVLSPSQLGVMQNTHGNPTLVSSYGVENNFGCVPVQIITAVVADQIFNHMFSDGINAVDWRTNLSSFYAKESVYFMQYIQLRIKVHMVNIEEVYYNVFGAIRGSHEPDRYVIVANNHEYEVGDKSEKLGAATAMMELVRVLADVRRNKGWHPHRSLVFCSWGSNHIIASHLPDQWSHIFESRALAYVGVETVFKGIVTLSAQATPILQSVLFESAKLVPNPRPEEEAKSNTIHATWLHNIDVEQNTPLVNSYFRRILHGHGIPNLIFTITNDQEEISKDTNLDYLRALTQLWGVLVWKLSDSPIIPFDVVQYSKFLNHSIAAISTKFHETIAKHTLPLSNLSEAVQNFSHAAMVFQRKVKTADPSNVLKIRILNDQLLQIEQSFLHHTIAGEAGPAFRHIILSPGKYLDNDPTSGFGILQDLLSDLTLCPMFTSIRASILSHVHVLIHCTRSATYLLQDSLTPLVSIDV